MNGSPALGTSFTEFFYRFFFGASTPAIGWTTPPPPTPPTNGGEPRKWRLPSFLFLRFGSGLPSQTVYRVLPSFCLDRSAKGFTEFYWVFFYGLRCLGELPGNGC